MTATKKEKTKMMAVQAPEDLHRAVKSAAALSGVTLGSAILRGLELYIEEARRKGAK